MPPLRGLDDALAGVRLLRTLPSLLRNPLTPERARTRVQQRLEQRQATFLAIAREAIYRRPMSPYLRMLEGIGCEYGDLDRLVKSDGLEAALRVLFLQGVYVNVEEFKGRRPIVRGTLTIEPDPTAFLNPFSERDVPAASSGSRGTRSATMLGLSFIRDCGAATCLAFEARGGLSWEKPPGRRQAGAPCSASSSTAASAARSVDGSLRSIPVKRSFPVATAGGSPLCAEVACWPAFLSPAPAIRRWMSPGPLSTGCGALSHVAGHHT